MAIADLLDLRTTRDAILKLRLPQSGRGKDEFGYMNWLLQVADSDKLSLVAYQLQGKSCRLLLDWLYHVRSCLVYQNLQSNQTCSDTVVG